MELPLARDGAVIDNPEVILVRQYAAESPVAADGSLRLAGRNAVFRTSALPILDGGIGGRIGPQGVRDEPAKEASSA